MFKDITLGQYVPGNSFIHKLDARVKIVLIFIYTCILFIIKNPLSYVIFAVFTFVMIFISKVPIKFILKGLKPMMFILIFTAFLNLFLTSGEALWAIDLFGDFKLSITYEGINLAVIMIVRLILLLMGTSILTLTTTPIMLTDAIEFMLAPFKKIGVPSHEIAMMMTIAMRFIPTLAEETDKIIKAQTARGADFESGNIIKRSKAMLPVLIPLFISAFRRADELSTAMESRCYNGGINRTRMKIMKTTKKDAAAVCIFSIFFICTVVCELFLKGFELL